MSKNNYEGQKIAIIAEGGDTINFIKQVCEEHEITVPIHFVDFTIDRKTGDEIENVLATLLLESKAGLERIGIIADAAADRQKMHERVEALVETHKTADCQISFILLPDEGDGGLESLLIQTIKPKYENLKECAQSFLQCIGNPHVANIEKHDKAVMNLIVRAQEVAFLHAIIARTKKPQLSTEDFLFPRGKRNDFKDIFDLHAPATTYIVAYLSNLVSDLKKPA